MIDLLDVTEDALSFLNYGGFSVIFVKPKNKGMWGVKSRGLPFSEYSGKSKIRPSVISAYLHQEPSKTFLKIPEGDYRGKNFSHISFINVFGLTGTPVATVALYFTDEQREVCGETDLFYAAHRLRRAFSDLAEEYKSFGTKWYVDEKRYLSDFTVRILKCMCDGMEDTESAQLLNRSVKSIQYHIDKAKGVLDARNRAHLAALVVDRRWVRPK